MNESQGTLADSVEIRGVGLFLGRPVTVRCLPAEADAGVVFVRTDLPGRPQVPAHIEHVPGQARWTALLKGDVEVRMVEHILAALYGLGIDNMVVEVDSVEMPTGDGSSKTFTDAFLRAGIRKLHKVRRCVPLKEPVWISEGDMTMVALPQEEGLTLTYVLDYGPHFVRAEAFTITLDRDVFLKEIAPAKTYVLRPEIDVFLKLGLGKGATPENTIVVEEDGRLEGPLRFRDECVRHKVLDLLGDLYLVGTRFTGRVLGYKSGHTSNVLLAQALCQALEKKP